jgi:outer membrane immunogenic protein
MSSRVRLVAFSAALLVSTAAVHADEVIDNAVAGLLGGWTGSYAGAFAGASNFSVDSYADSGTFSSSSVGVYGGHNFELPGGVVFGVESDFAKANGDIGWSDGEEGANFAVNWTAHLRSRVGMGFGNALFYAAGGVALAQGTLDVYSAGYSDTQIHTGVTIGAGVDVAVSPNLVLRAEYLHDQFATATYDIDGYDTDIDLSSDTVRAGIAFKF